MSANLTLTERVKGKGLKYTAWTYCKIVDSTIVSCVEVDTHRLVFQFDGNLSKLTDEMKRRGLYQKYVDFT